MDAVTGQVGFGNFDQGNLISLEDPALHSYGLATDFGPVTGTNLYLNQFQNVDTSLGLLSFTDMGDVAFQATLTAVPEPASLALFGAGAVGLSVGFRRTRSRRSRRASVEG